MRGRVLICAGSDSGGGAGIQADIKAVTALGGFAMTAITALTAQSTQGVFGVAEVSPDFIRQQMQVVLDDIGADAVKTGMLHKPEVIRAVAETLEHHAPGVHLVVDPVMVAKGGHKLLNDDAHDALKTLLLPRASILTPNIPEAEALTGMSIATPEQMVEAGKVLLALGPKAVLVKGGHLERDNLTDVLLTAGGAVHLFQGERLKTSSTHGTGCTLASAIATGLAQGLSTYDAVARARSYVRIAIETAPGFGKGHGPLNHAHTVRPFGAGE